jgi:hypothetical protein
MAASSSSPASACLLLQLAEQLSDDWWAHSMMPHLLEAKVAKKLASTCKQLCGLCQRAATALQVHGFQLQHVQVHTCQRFPSCKQLTVHLEHREQAVFDMPTALGVLTG